MKTKIGLLRIMKYNKKIFGAKRRCEKGFESEARLRVLQFLQVVYRCSTFHSKKIWLPVCLGSSVRLYISDSCSYE
jgi:hypothetical protein